MKKIFTLFLAAAACTMSLSAAQFELTRYGQVLADGAKFQVGYEVASYDIISVYTQDTALKLKADPSLEITVKIESTISNLQFCGFGECVTGASIIKAGNTKSAEEALPLLIDVAKTSVGGTQVVMPEGTVVITVYPTSAPDEAVTVTADFLNKPAEEVNGVGSIVNDQAPAVYYDITGQRVENPTKGLYIKRQGNKTTKVLIK